MVRSENNKPKHLSSEPSVIPVFFATEMWERFGFYMIQGLLILYMTSHVFGFSDSKSYAILGAFSAIAYTTPILGGYVASKILDYEHAIILGGFLLVIGYALLSLPHEQLFYVALAIIATGNGFFKPSTSSYLGDFYKKNDSYREKGYTIFYIGINFGVVLSTSMSGFLVRYFGWHLPFLIAAIALFFGIVTFVFGIYYLKEIKRFNRIEPSVARKNPKLIVLVYIAAIVITAISYEVIRHRVIAGQLMLWGSIATLLGLIIMSLRYKNAIRNKLIACVTLIFIAVIFWSLYFQMFFSMSLFVERVIDRRIFNTTLPTPLFFGLESIFVIIIGLFFAKLWGKLSKKNKNIGFPLKFTLALFTLVIMFLIAYISTQHTNADGLINMLFIIAAYLFIATGELLLSPVGMSMITILVPQELTGVIMGLWFVAIGLGEKLASVIASYAAIPKNIHLVSTMDKIYGQAFYQFMLLSLLCTLICAISIPFLNSMIGEEKKNTF